MNAIEEKIRAYILNEFLPGEPTENLSTTTTLVTSGILDSISSLKLVDFLEKEFGIRIEPHELDKDYLETIPAIGQLVQGKLDSA